MSYAATIADCLDRGERVDVHLWWNGEQRVVRARKDHPLPDRRIFLVEATDKAGIVQRYVDPRRLLLLPRRRAEELLADNGAHDERDTFDVHDALERALRRPERFGPDAYGRLDLDGLRRIPAMTTEEKLASIPRCEGVEEVADWYVPPRAAVTRGPDNDNDPAWRSLLEQVGMSIDASGRYHVTPPEPGLEHWLEQLRALDTAPTYVNGVPVRRQACTPMRFEVACYELSANVGMGSGARERITKVMTLWEAAAFVRAGKCPHYKYSPTAGRWSETA